MERINVTEPSATSSCSMIVEDAHNPPEFTPNRKRKMQRMNGPETSATPTRSDSGERAPNLSVFTPKHKRKASDHPSTEEKVSAACRLYRRYTQITEEARYARGSRDQADLNAKTAKDGRAFLKCKLSSIRRKEEEEEERRRAIDTEIQLLKDQRLATDDDIKDQDVELEEAEAYYRKMEIIHAEKHQRSKLLEFLMDRRKCVGFMGSHLQGCTKDDLCFLYEITSSDAVTKLTLTNMKDIFRDLRMGGYDDLKREWKERMGWTSEDWDRKGGFPEKREKREWMENMFLEIFGFKNVENPDN